MNGLRSGIARAHTGTAVCAAAIAANILMAAGCGTISDIRHPRALGAAPYGGVAADSEAISYMTGHMEVPHTLPWDAVSDLGPEIVIPLACGDLLLSAVGDTLALPYTIPRARGAKKP